VYEATRRKYDENMSGHFESTSRHKRRKLSSRDELHEDSARYIAIEGSGSARKGAGDQRTEVSFRNGLTVPREIYGNLLQYQLAALRWMWELRKKSHGGILGDEMVSFQQEKQRIHES
jgi:SNF2 family DNA or RNA helicase